MTKDCIMMIIEARFERAAACRLAAIEISITIVHCETVSVLNNKCLQMQLDLICFGVMSPTRMKRTRQRAVTSS
jgi:glutamate racemase